MTDAMVAFLAILMAFCVPFVLIALLDFTFRSMEGTESNNDDD